jgi:hypothetical protein
MLASKPTGNPARQAGVYAVEFSIVVVLFLTLMFGIIEVARAMYLFNTLQEATRRAASLAAVTNFRNAADMQGVREQALFLTEPGELSLGSPISDRHIRIDYLALVRDASGTSTMTPIPDSSLPSCAARNRVICMANRNDASCIRFVRARVCDPANTSECVAVRYRPLSGLIDLPIDLPRAPTIATAETLGFTSDMTTCL